MKWIIEHKKMMIIGLLSFLFIFVLTVSFHFFREDELKLDIKKDPVVLPNEDELEFINQSSLSVDEIWNIVSSRKDSLRHLFFESTLNEPHDIDPTHYTVSDNALYVVFPSAFISKFQELVVDEIYFKFLEEMTLIKDQYYIAPKDIFEDIYLNSVITEVDVQSSEVRLVSASDERINANVALQICEEDDASCIFNVPFELSKINAIWKVSAFYYEK
jgi:hypothetical protein